MYRTSEQQMSIYDYLPPYHANWPSATVGSAWPKPSTGMPLKKNTAATSAMWAKWRSRRVAFGCLIVRAACGVSDRETVALIRESPYLQYFLGFESFTDTVPFSARSMERFRTRIPAEKVRWAVRMLRRFEAES